MAAGKKPATTTAKPEQGLVTYPTLIPQPGGRGALLSGGIPGNPGNTQPVGRPASAIRARLRGSFEERIPVAEAIADSPTETSEARLKAVDLLGKYGLGQVKELSTEAVRDKLRETLGIIRDSLLPADAARLIARLEGVWREQ